MATTKTAAKPKRATTSKPSTAKAPAKATAAKAAPKASSRRVFEPGRCHHRNAQGQPDCTKAIEAKRANLCPTHEKEWQKAARLRYAERRAESGAKTTKATSKPAAKKAAPSKEEPSTSTPAADADELEAQLEASVKAFATPELAALHRQKRKAATTAPKRSR